MNNKKDTKKDDELRRQQDADRAAANQSITAATTLSPLQAMREGEVMRWNDWKNSKGEFAGKPLDVFEAPSLGPSLSLYRHAKAGQVGERAGIGALRMGLNATSPEVAANLAEQSKLRREQDAAGQLEEAVALKDAEMNDTALPLIQLNQSRALGVAGLRAGQAGQSQSLWSQFRVRPGWLPGLANNFAQGAGQAVGAFA